MCSLYEQEDAEVAWINRKQNMKVELREVADPATSPNEQPGRSHTFISGSQTHTTKHTHNPEGQNCLGTLRRPHGWDPHGCYALGVPAMGPFAPKVFPSLPLLYYAAEGPAPGLLCRRPDPWVGKIPWRKEWLPTPVFLTGEFHGQRKLGAYSPGGCKELGMTEQLTLTFYTINFPNWDT